MQQIFYLNLDWYFPTFISDVFKVPSVKGFANK